MGNTKGSIRGHYKITAPNKGWFKSSGKKTKEKCSYCGTFFEFYASLRIQKYCSIKCFHLSRVGVKRPKHATLMREYAVLGKVLAKRRGPQTDTERENTSKRMIARWANKSDPLNSDENRQKISDRNVALAKLGRGVSMYNRGHARGRQGTYDINGKKMFFRSLWEVNYALYLDFLIKQKHIQSWEYEADTFWFEAIRRGVRSYMPDFKILTNGNTIEYHEVKGWMDPKSATKLKRMAKYYPQIKMVLIEGDQYKEIKKKLGRIIGFYE